VSAVLLATSVLVSIIVEDGLSARADTLLSGLTGAMIVSNFAEAEFASALARRVRQSELMPAKAQQAFSVLDNWLDERCRREPLVSADIATTAVILRRLEFPLRTPDALHLCMAKRLGAALATFDAQLARIAAELDVAVLG
jgi:predicted nucleic acid-binding protein